MTNQILQSLLIYYAFGWVLLAFTFYGAKQLPETDPDAQAFQQTLEAMARGPRSHAIITICLVPLLLPALGLFHLLGIFQLP